MSYINLSNAFSIQKGLKQGGALSPLLFVCYVNKKVQENQEGIVFNGTNQTVVYADFNWVQI
jgi:hypothetical protein